MKTSTVLILGAGATRGALADHRPIPPIDSDFFELAQTIKEGGVPARASKMRESVFQLYGKVDSIGMELCYRDFETRQKISAIAKAGGKPKDWIKRIWNLSDLIQRIFTLTTSEVPSGKIARKGLRSSYHEEILKILKKGDSLITFNYDLLVEESISKPSQWNPIDGYGKNIRWVAAKKSDWVKGWFRERSIDISIPVKSNIQILKLHGSLNWELMSGRRIRVKTRPYKIDPNKNSQKALLLFPTWNKEGIQRLPFNLIWPAARTALQQATRVAIAGYSLPETDLLARALFGEVVRYRRDSKHRQAINELWVCDPKVDVRSRWIELFRPIFTSKTRIFESGDFKEFSKTFK